MEDFEYHNLDNLDLELEIDDDTAASLKEAARWTKFISILMFCFCGLLLLFLLFASASSNFADGLSSSVQQLGAVFRLNSLVFLTAAIIVIVLIVLTIYYFLFHFSRKTKIAVIAQSTEELNKGLNSLKIYFIIYAALVILSISTSVFTFLKYF